MVARGLDAQAIVRSQLTRRGVLHGAGLTAAAAASAAILAGCTSQAKTASGAGSGAGNYPTTPKFKFVFINHVTTNTFFQPTQYAMADAAALLGLPTPQWTGSETSNVSQMVTAMNTAISAKVDGIAVSLVDQQAFNEPVNRALAAGIPVVSYNADVPTNSRLAYIGQDLFASGQAMGKRIAAALPDGSSVAIFIATPGSLNIQPRADGAVSAIKASGKNITVKQVATGADQSGEQSAIDAFYTGNKAVKGLYAVDAGSTAGVAAVMTKYKLAGSGYHGGGFDLLTTTLTAIQAGVLDFTIDQSAYLQGFLPTMYLYLYKLSGSLVSPPTTNTGLKFVTKVNVAPYLKSTNRYEGSSPKQVYIQS
jgi:simple sugar transport system substrate-binding protein